MGFNASDPRVVYAFPTNTSETSIMESIFAKIAQETTKFDVGDEEVESQSSTSEDPLEADEK